MSTDQFYIFHLEFTPGRVLVETTDPQAVKWIVEEVRKLIPGCQTKKFGVTTWTRIEKLQGRDDEIGGRVRDWLITAGWEIVNKYYYDGESLYQFTFRRRIAPLALGASSSGQIANIGDQLEKLNILHKSGALSDAEFAAAKRKLLGT